MQECAVYTLMSMKMATDLTKPLDFIASGFFSEKGPAFRKFFPMTPPPLLCPMMSLLCLGVKCVLVCEGSPIPPPPLCRDIVMEFLFMRAIWMYMYMCPLAVTHSSSWFGIARVFVNGGNHPAPPPPPSLAFMYMYEQEPEGGGTEEE